jgi:rRNA-processing protein FCF1
MQPLANSVSPSAYRHELSSQLFNGRITSHCREPIVVFLDTNILLWMYRLNDDARKDLLHFLERLIEEGRLRIPGWVVHEYNLKVERIDELVFRPLDTLLKTAKRKLDELQPHVSMIASEEAVAGTEYKTKKNFLASWEATKSQFDKHLKVLSNARRKQSRDARQEVGDVIEKVAMKTDIFSLLRNSQREGKVRFNNRLAPGHMDSWKETNSLGDFIIWKEIILEAALIRRSAVLISNDRKLDWVYAPPNLEMQDGSLRPNDGIRELKMYLPQPYLLAEFTLEVGSELSFSIVNSDLLAHLLGSNVYNPESHASYGNLLASLVLDSEDTPTHEIIGWFLNNPDLLREAIHGPARWEHCPSEISVSALRAFVEDKFTDVKGADVAWDTVIMELFI